LTTAYANDFDDGLPTRNMRKALSVLGYEFRDPMRDYAAA
jgi:hypothetical protein